MKILFRPEGGDTGATTTTTSTDDAASKGTAGAAAATTTEAWKAPENKEAVDKLIADAVEAAKPKLPEKYDLKLPEKSKVDPAITERTAATARTLGLSNDAAQKTLDFIAQEVNSHAEARVKEITDSFAPGGKGWNETVQKWNEEALADPAVGNGKPEVFEQKKALATKVAAKFGDKAFVELLKNDPMGSHPAVIRFLANIGGAMGESALVLPTDAGGGEPKKTSELFYPKKEAVTA